MRVGPLLPTLQDIRRSQCNEDGHYLDVTEVDHPVYNEESVLYPCIQYISDGHYLDVTEVDHPVYNEESVLYPCIQYIYI